MSQYSEDVEIVREDEEVAATDNNKQLTLSSSSVELSNPKGLVEFAKELKQFIVNERLYTPIAGKNYVEVQGWQFCMLSTGVVPIIVSTKDLSNDNEIKYMASVELRRMSDNQVIGTGVAICSNLEKKKKSFDDYAVLSMAQTRAIGKAGRNTFGWLMKMAGYEATPAEEMGENGEYGDGGELSAEIVEKIKSAKTKEDFNSILSGLDVDQRKAAAEIITKRLSVMHDDDSTKQKVEQENITEKGE